MKSNYQIFTSRYYKKKQKLINQSESLEFDYTEHFDKKEQYIEKKKKITNKNKKSIRNIRRKKKRKKVDW